VMAAFNARRKDGDQVQDDITIVKNLVVSL
jgi:hypothetical protein